MKKKHKIPPFEGENAQEKNMFKALSLSENTH